MLLSFSFLDTGHLGVALLKPHFSRSCMPLLFRYLPLPDRYQEVPRRGLSERLVKRRLEQRGWKVWRGALLNILRRAELYPVVRRKYELLKELLDQRHPGTFEVLELLAAVHHGLPDFLAYHPAEGFRFVECKLGHEQLLESQKRCFPKLQALGFAVEVHVLVESCTKTRRAVVDFEAAEKRVLERQLRLTKKLLRVKRRKRMEGEA